MKFSFPQILLPALAALLVACLLPLPYGFYVLVRFVAAGAFALLAVDAFDRASNNRAWAFVALTLLFQPFFKLALGRPLVEHRRCGGGRLAPLFVAERTMKLPHAPQLAPKSGRPRPNRAFGRGRYLMSVPSPSVGKAPDCEGERDFIWKAQVRRCALLRANVKDICYRRWCTHC